MLLEALSVWGDITPTSKHKPHNHTHFSACICRLGHKHTIRSTWDESQRDSCGSCQWSAWGSEKRTCFKVDQLFTTSKYSWIVRAYLNVSFNILIHLCTWRIWIKDDDTLGFYHDQNEHPMIAAHMHRHYPHITEEWCLPGNPIQETKTTHEDRFSLQSWQNINVCILVGDDARPDK